MFTLTPRTASFAGRGAWRRKTILTPVVNQTTILWYSGLGLVTLPSFDSYLNS